MALLITVVDFIYFYVLGKHEVDGSAINIRAGITKRENLYCHTHYISVGTLEEFVGGQ